MVDKAVRIGWQTRSVWLAVDSSSTMRELNAKAHIAATRLQPCLTDRSRSRSRTRTNKEASEVG